METLVFAPQYRETFHLDVDQHLWPMIRRYAPKNLPWWDKIVFTAITIGKLKKVPNTLKSPELINPIP